MVFSSENLEMLRIFADGGVYSADTMRGLLMSKPNATDVSVGQEMNGNTVQLDGQSYTRVRNEYFTDEALPFVLAYQAKLGLIASDLESN